MNNLKLPDFEDINRVAAEDEAVLNQLYAIKRVFDKYLASCIKEAFTNPDYFIKGKPPIAEFVRNVIMVSGNTEEDAKVIEEMRSKIDELDAKHQYLRQILQSLRDEVSIYQTISANKRAGLMT